MPFCATIPFVLKPDIMKKTIIFSSIAIITVLVAYVFVNQEEELTEIEKLRKQHKEFVLHSPYKDTKNLSRAERKALSMPPNAYYDREYELTMNPQLGYPTPYIPQYVDVSLVQAKGLPGNGNATWTERGPINVGGRTRVAFYDPNDVGSNNGDGVDYNRVFAGGVSGGLWVNNNINSATSSWNIVPGLAGGLNVNCYAIDPNDSNTWYIGTGEQYTSGAAIGNGVYKTTDGGVTWSPVNITPAGPGTSTNGTTIFNAGLFFVNDIVVRNVAGVSEIYVGIGSALVDSPNFNISNPTNALGAQNAGLYRSVDNGTSWSRIESPIMGYIFAGTQFYVIPNDLEIGADNTLYFGSISSTATNNGGGRVYRSTDGLTWNLAQFIPQSDRVEIAPSKSNADLFYIATQVGGNQANLFKTTNRFATVTAMNEPNDADNSIPATDFTRGQAFYDLVIEVDPTNNDIIYAGGIDLHRSTNGGTTWNQISKWSENPNLNTLNTPFIHADIHSLTFHPTNPNQGLVGSDGGVSWASSFSSAINQNNAIQDRILGYNVTQYYYGTIYENGASNGDDLAGGSQDNGTTAIVNGTPGLNAFTPVLGGDGAFAEIDKDGNYAIVSTQYENHRYVSYPSFSGGYCITGNCNDNSKGDFINVAELDENLNYFYANTRNFSNTNAISVCQLLPSTAACTTISNSLISSSRPTAFKVSPFTTTSTKLYVGTEFSGLIRIDNANTTSPQWTTITGSGFLGSVSDIEFGASEQEIFVTMHNYGVQNIWYTNNGGATWSGKEGNLPDMPVKAILKNPLLGEEVIIGTDLGVWATGDFNSPSPTWFPVMNGMTNVKVVDLDLRTSDNTILATTHGRGMFTGVFTTAGIQDVRNTNVPITIYPTITTGEITIASTITSNDIQLVVYSLSGQQVYADRLKLNGTEQRVYLGNLKSGIYLVKTVTDGISQTTKIVRE